MTMGCFNLYQKTFNERFANFVARRYHNSDGRSIELNYRNRTFEERYKAQQDAEKKDGVYFWA